MAINILRQTGSIGRNSEVTIKIDGIKVAKVNEGQEIVVELPSNKARLTVSQPGGAKSNEIEANDGETIEITSTKWMKLSLFLPLPTLFLTNFISNTTYKIVSLVTIVVLFVAGAFLMNYFHLEVLDKKDK